MRLLIDTQALIWFVENDKSLPIKIKELMKDADNSILISIASLWEMTIKMSIGKLNINCTISEMFDKLTDNGFELLPVLPEHIVQLSMLEYIHRDPFDRIIISQGLSENIKIVSSDSIFDKYTVKRVWK